MSADLLIGSDSKHHGLFGSFPVEKLVSIVSIQAECPWKPLLDSQPGNRKQLFIGNSELESSPFTTKYSMMREIPFNRQVAQDKSFVKLLLQPDQAYCRNDE
jgi:hypothetical protein